MEITMQGNRIYPDKTGLLRYFHAGDYGKAPDGIWWARPPIGVVGSLVDHEITEHEDGAITVSPSIWSDEWHGYLKHGVWTEA